MRSALAGLLLMSVVCCASTPLEHPDCESYQSLERRAKERGEKFQSAIVIKRVDPEYPVHLRESRIQGEVILLGCISTEGAVENIKVVHAADPELTEAALKAFREWKFKPATVGGVRSSMSMRNTFAFRLY